MVKKTNLSALGEVQDHVSKIVIAAQLVASLETAIVQQEKIVTENSAATVGDLYQRRQDLLADSVQGGDVAEEIEALDTEIREAEAVLIATDKARRDAEDAVVGLKRKLAGSVQLLTNLKSSTKDLLYPFLAQEAEAVAKEYISAAETVRATYTRLKGINEVLQSLSSGFPNFALGAYEVEIPCFHLEAFSGIDESTAGVYKSIFSGKGFNNDAARRGEVARLREHGIEI